MIPRCKRVYFILRYPEDMYGIITGSYKCAPVLLSYTTYDTNKIYYK